MYWFNYHQNNSGGFFTGPARWVAIKAETAEAANQAAERLGLYWNGVSTGCDCECCGDRWYPCDDEYDGELCPDKPYDNASQIILNLCPSEYRIEFINMTQEERNKVEAKLDLPT